MNLQEKKLKLIQSFSSKNNQEIIACFNQQVKQKESTQKGDLYAAALHDELTKRKIDYSLIGNKINVSFNEPILLRNHTVYPISNTSNLPNNLLETKLLVHLYTPTFSVDDLTKEQIIHFPFLSSYIIPCLNKKKILELIVWEDIAKEPKKINVFPSTVDGQYSIAVAGIIIHISTSMTF